MPRTLNTQNNLVELLSRAPSPWDSYDPAIDYAEPEAPKPADPTETPVEHLIFVLEVKMMEGLANGKLVIIVDNPKQVEAVHEFLARKAG